MARDHVGLTHDGSAAPHGTEPRRSAAGKATLTQRMPASARAIARAVAAAMTTTPGAETHVDRAVGGTGRSLPDGVRARFEASLGVDLGGVRVHDGDAAATAAAAVGARAFAFGQDVFMGAGEYAPDSPAGARLLAHEVAHTVQQRGSATVPQYKLEMTTPGDAAEVEADRAAEAMVAGDPFAIGAASTSVARIARWTDERGAGEVLAAIARADLPAIRQLILALETARANATPGVALGDRTMQVAVADLHDLEARARARFGELEGAREVQAGDGGPDASFATDASASATEHADADARAPAAHAPTPDLESGTWADVGDAIQINRTLYEPATRGPGFVYVRKVEARGTLRAQRRGRASPPSRPAPRPRSNDAHNHPTGLGRPELTGIGYNTGRGRDVGPDATGRARPADSWRGRTNQVRMQVAERDQFLNYALDSIHATVTSDAGIQATGGQHQGNMIGSLGITSNSALTWSNGEHALSLAFAPEFRFVDRGDGAKAAEFMRLLLTTQADLTQSIDESARLMGRVQLTITLAPGEQFIAWVARQFGEGSAALLRTGTTAAHSAAQAATTTATEHAAERGAAAAATNATEHAAERGAAAAATTTATEHAAERGAAAAATNATEHAAENAALRGGGEAALEGGARVGARGALARGAAALGTVAEVMGVLDLPAQVTLLNLWMWHHAWESGQRDASLARRVQRDLFDCCMSYASVMTGGSPRGGRPGADGAQAAEQRIARAVAAGYSRERIFEATRTYPFAGRYGLPAWYQQVYVEMAPRARAAAAQEQGFLDVVGAAIDAVDQGGYGYRALGGW